ncbi:uroporphyrinogen-III synthase [Amorphus coralli]|uniref:uroporphyrinogen-III synthase n=1 Tax=Amorphus coralli TaxID=340680 RepID=UPI00035D18C3|nr:uroporphyrinogen-III synthase [Amorphus coralli]
MRILVTRPLPQAEETAERLAAMGHEPVLSPLLDIVPDPTVSLDPGDAKALVLTSRGAVRALARHPELARVIAMPTVTVGDATAEAARAAGFRDVRSAGGTVADLAATLAADPNRPRAVLYLAGRDRSGDLAGLLAEAGTVVDLRVCYRAETASALTAEASAGLKEGDIDTALSFSPRSAETLVRLADRAGVGAALAEINHACLSESVADVLRGAGARRIIVAERPDQEALLALLTRQWPSADRR